MLLLPIRTAVSVPASDRLGQHKSGLICSSWYFPCEENTAVGTSKTQSGLQKTPQSFAHHSEQVSNFN